VDDFYRAIKDEIFPRLLISTNKPLYRSTIYRWLPKLGFFKSEVKKGVYVDGHERKDVVQYRQKVFLPLMLKLESYAWHYIEREDGT